MELACRPDTVRWPGRWVGLVGLVVAVGQIGCSGSLPPLRGQIAVGRDGYAVVVGGEGDLYAVRAQGGPVVPITFSRLAELRPRLSPDGGRLGFLRGASAADSTPATVWIMNLETGGERAVALPKGAQRPDRLGWRADELVIAAADGRPSDRLIHCSAPSPPTR